MNGDNTEFNVGDLLVYDGNKTTIRSIQRKGDILFLIKEKDVVIKVPSEYIYTLSLLNHNDDGEDTYHVTQQNLLTNLRDDMVKHYPIK